jgi:transcriptional regulator with XRE-family HTH domain
MARTLGERVRAERMTLGMSQVGLARAAAISQPKLSKLESGIVRETSLEMMLAIAKTLRVRPEWLVLGSGVKEAPEGELDAELLDMFLTAARVAEPKRTQLLDLLSGLLRVFEASPRKG